LPQYCLVCLICQIYITIGQRIVIAGSPPTIAIIVYCLIIHARMSSPFPHRATSPLNLPEHQLLAPPALPLLAGCRCRRCAAVAAATLPPRFPKRCHRVRSCASAKLPPPQPCWPPPPRCRCHRHRRRRCAATAPAPAALLPPLLPHSTAAPPLRRRRCCAVTASTAALPPPPLLRCPPPLRYRRRRPTATAYAALPSTTPSPLLSS
jgi:hypothetical protein